MYHSGQIVYSLTTRKPVRCDDPDVTGWRWAGHPDGHRTTHFIRSNDEYRKFLMSFGKYEGPKPDEYVIALPKTVEEAEEQMKKGLISFAPCSSDHHWKCGHWKSRCKCEDKS